MENVIFLDYDGVVNTLIYDSAREDFYFNFPKDNSVNNYQACKWIEKLCKENNAKIVVISTWRRYENYKECLYNGGLSRNIEIIDKIDDCYNSKSQGIVKYLSEHSNIEKYIIIDDQIIEGDEISKHFIKTETYRGFDYYEYQKAKLAFKGLYYYNKKE